MICAIMKVSVMIGTVPFIGVAQYANKIVPSAVGCLISIIQFCLLKMH